MMVFIAHNLAPIIFASAIVFMLLGYPIAFSLAANGIFFFFVGLLLQPFAPSEISLSWSLLQVLPDRVFGIMSNEILLALPFFTFMGLVLERSGMAEDLLDTVGQLFGSAPGGLAYTVILVGALLAATTGVVSASIIAMGLISLPIMLRYGYSRSIVSGTIIASGTLAQIIPPSIVLIILADQLGRPVGDMYEAALLPGMILIGAYLAFVMLVSVVRPSAMPGLPVEAIRYRTARGGRGLWQTGLLFAVAAIAAYAGVTALEALPVMDSIVIAITFGALVAFCATLLHRLLRGRPVLAVLVAVGLGALTAVAWSTTAADTVAVLASLIAVAGLFAAIAVVLDRLAAVTVISPLAERAAFVLMPPLVLIFLVLGTIFIGLATPTEGGAMGAIGAMLLALIKRAVRRDPTRINMRSFADAAYATARLSTFVMFILIGARIFSMTFYAVNGHLWIEELLLGLPGGEAAFIFFILTLIFILGFFLDFFEIAFIVIPLILPAAKSFGIDFTYFGVLIAIVVQTSYLTPPLGFGLFFLRSVAPDREVVDKVSGAAIAPIRTIDMYRGVLPFVLIQLAVATLLVLMPQLAAPTKHEPVLNDQEVEKQLLDIPMPAF